MSEVKPRRRYQSPRRTEQSAAIREAVLDAAEELFALHGYAGTSVKAVAVSANVALKTVYLACGNKRALLTALIDRRIRGDEAAVPVVDRPWFRESLAETDPRHLLRLLARNSRQVKGRASAVLEVIRTAAPSDPEIGGLWQNMQKQFHGNQRLFVEQLQRIGGLRPDLDMDRATDIVWTLNHPDVYRLLVIDREWSPEDYESWLADALASQLLRPVGS